MALTKVEAEQLQPAQTSITSVGTLTGLTVGGNVTVSTSGSTALTLSGDFPRLYFEDSAGSDLDAYIVNNANGLFFGKTNTPSSSNDIMALDLTNQRVGIGTGSPSAGLHVSTDINPVMKLDRGSANTTNANLYYNGTLTGQISAANANFQISAAGSSTPMSFYVNGSERMRLLANGSAVIGGGNSFAQQGGGLLTLEGPDAAMLVLHRTADTGDQEILFYDHGDHNATIIGKTGGELQFRTNARNTVAMHLKSDGNVGIGTDNPNQIFHIKNTGQHTTMRIENDNADFLIQAGDAGDDGLHFYDLTNTAYRMTIDNAGQVGIGTTSPGAKLDVAGTVRSTAQVGYRHTAHVTASGNSAPHKLQIGRWPSSGTRWLMVPEPEGSPLYSKEHGYSFTNSRWFTEGDFAVNSGNVVFTSGHGINFSATGVGHSTSNRSELLDDYEEGDWSPVIGGSSGQSGQSYNLQNGKYTKIGSFVNCTFDVQLSAQGSLSGTYLVMRNLPFAPVGNNLGGSANFGYVSGWSNLTYPITAYISGNNVYLMEGFSNYILINEYKHGNSSRLIGSIIYHTSQ